MISRVCGQCGITYETYPSIRLQFCGSKCAGLARRQRSASTCAQCGASFIIRPSEADKRFCSKSCARTAANLTEANPSRTRDLSGANNPMYGKGLRGEANGMHGRKGERAPRWNGGRRSRKDGYQLIQVPVSYPNPSEITHTGIRYALEHRVIMEQQIGRYLTSGEVVHHRDHNPSNNAPENLQLFASHAEHMRIGHS